MKNNKKNKNYFLWLQIVGDFSRRLPWLTLLLLLGIIVSSAVGLFESLVADYALIVSFQSLVLGMAGNAGTQALAITVRSITDGGTRRRPILSEFLTAGLGGISLGVISFLSVTAYTFILRKEDTKTGLAAALCVGLAIAVSFAFSGLIGALIPRALHRLGFDPAVASGPLITTASDLLAVLTYYGLAGLLLRGAFLQDF